jgi:hypothetical protein
MQVIRAVVLFLEYLSVNLEGIVFILHWSILLVTLTRGVELT